MKKLIALLLSSFLLVTLALSVCADFEIDPKDDTYTAYPIFVGGSAEKPLAYTDGVMFYSSEGKAVDLGTLSANTGEFINGYTIWTEKSHLPFDGNSVSVDPGAYVEITFTGTGFRLGTCYRTDVRWPALKLEIDGVEYDADEKMYWADFADDTTPTVLTEVAGLENKTHVVRITSVGEDCADFDWFEIRGTLGAGTAGDTASETEEKTPTKAEKEAAATTKEETTAAATEQTTTTAAAEQTESSDITEQTEADTTTAADESEKDDDEGGIPVGAAIGIIAAVAVIVAVAVIIIVKKKK